MMLTIRLRNVCATFVTLFTLLALMPQAANAIPTGPAPVVGFEPYDITNNLTNPVPAPTLITGYLLTCTNLTIAFTSPSAYVSVTVADHNHNSIDSYFGNPGLASIDISSLSGPFAFVVFATNS